MRKSIKQSGKLKFAERVTIEMRNAKWETRNRNQRAANQKTRTAANPKSKSKTKWKTKTMREANANQNSKRNHIMTIAKRSDNAKCEIKFAFAAHPLHRPGYTQY